MSITCGDDTQLLDQYTYQSCCSNAYNIVLSKDIFSLKAEHEAHEQTWLLNIPDKFFFFSVATAMHMACILSHGYSAT